MPSTNARVGTVDASQPAETNFCPICNRVAELHAYFVPSAVPMGLGGGGERYQLITPSASDLKTAKICAGCGSECGAKQIGVTMDGQVTVGGKLASEAGKVKTAEFRL